MIRFKRRDNTTQVFSHRSYRLCSYENCKRVIVNRYCMKKVAHPYEIQNTKVLPFYSEFNYYKG